MSFQTFTCCICDEKNITKKNSYAVPGKGRACRKHEEAIKAHVDTIEQEENIKQQKIKSADKKHYHNNYDIASYLGKHRDPKSYCWSCDKDGLMTNLLVNKAIFHAAAMEVVKEDQIADIFKESRQEFLTQIDKKIMLKSFQVDENYPDWKFKHIVKSKSMQWGVAKMLKTLILCEECATMFEFTWQELNISNKNLARFVYELGSEINSNAKAIIRTAVAIGDMKERNKNN